MSEKKERESAVYQDRKTKTVWKYDASTKQLTCAVCRGELWLCRGCGLSSTYSENFGCCSTSIICPNCFVLKAPDMDSDGNLESNQRWNSDGVVEADLDFWVRRLWEKKYKHDIPANIIFYEATFKGDPKGKHDYGDSDDEKDEEA